jgi:hypothetical protein
MLLLSDTSPLHSLMLAMCHNSAEFISSVTNCVLWFQPVLPHVAGTNHEWRDSQVTNKDPQEARRGSHVTRQVARQDER